MERTTIMLPNSLKAKAQKRASSMGMSLGEYIRNALKDSFVKHQNKELLEDVLFSDDAVSDGLLPKDMSENHDKYLYEAS